MKKRLIPAGIPTMMVAVTLSFCNPLLADKASAPELAQVKAPSYSKASFAAFQTKSSPSISDEAKIDSRTKPANTHKKAGLFMLFLHATSGSGMSAH